MKSLENERSHRDFSLDRLKRIEWSKIDETLQRIYRSKRSFLEVDWHWFHMEYLEYIAELTSAYHGHWFSCNGSGQTIGLARIFFIRAILLSRLVHRRHWSNVPDLRHDNNRDNILVPPFSNQSSMLFSLPINASPYFASEFRLMKLSNVSSMAEFVDPIGIGLQNVDDRDQRKRMENWILRDKYKGFSNESLSEEVPLDEPERNPLISKCIFLPNETDPRWTPSTLPEIRFLVWVKYNCISLFDSR